MANDRANPGQVPPMNRCSYVIHDSRGGDLRCMRLSCHTGKCDFPVEQPTPSALPDPAHMKWVLQDILQVACDHGSEVDGRWLANRAASGLGLPPPEHVYGEDDERMGHPSSVHSGEAPCTSSVHKTSEPLPPGLHRWRDIRNKSELPKTETQTNKVVAPEAEGQETAHLSGQTVGSFCTGLTDDYLENGSCTGVLPGTFVACGEFGYCSDLCLILGSFKCGAAVAFGLMGMAEAIRARHYYGTFTEPSRYDDIFFEGVKWLDEP